MMLALRNLGELFMSSVLLVWVLAYIVARLFFASFRFFVLGSGDFSLSQNS